MAGPAVPTYSQSLTCISDNGRYGNVKTIIMGDTDIAGNAVAIGNANAVGAQQGACSRNDYILCKGHDGLLSYHTIDAERSILPNYIILRKV